MNPIGSVFIAFELSFIRAKFWSVIDKSTVPGAGRMPDMEEFVVQDVIQNEIRYQRRIEEQADEDRMMCGVVTA